MQPLNKSDSLPLKCIVHPCIHSFSFPSSFAFLDGERDRSLEFSSHFNQDLSKKMIQRENGNYTFDTNRPLKLQLPL